MMVVTGWLAYSQKWAALGPAVRPPSLRSFQSYRPHPFSSCLAVSAIDGISARVAIDTLLSLKASNANSMSGFVRFCAIKVVGDNGGKPGAPTFEDLM